MVEKWTCKKCGSDRHDGKIYACSGTTCAEEFCSSCLPKKYLECPVCYNIYHHPSEMDCSWDSYVRCRDCDADLVEKFRGRGRK